MKLLLWLSVIVNVWFVLDLVNFWLATFIAATLLVSMGMGSLLIARSQFKITPPGV